MLEAERKSRVLARLGHCRSYFTRMEPCYPSFSEWLDSGARISASMSAAGREWRIKPTPDTKPGKVAASELVVWGCLPAP